ARDTQALEDRPEVHGIGNLLALTDNEDLNNVLCRQWTDTFGRYHVFGWHSAAGAPSVSRELTPWVVWSRLPRPSILSSNLDHARARLKVEEVSNPKDAARNGPLLLAGPGVVFVDPSNASSPNAGNVSHAMVLERRTGYLIEALRPQLFLRSQTADLATLLKQLIDRFLELVPQLPAHQLVQELVERERVLSSAIGEGVAIPHAYNKAVPMRLCGLALVPNGLAIATMDERPVRLVFLLIGPPGDPEGHLALIAEVAGLAADEDVRERLVEATSFDEVQSVIRERLTDR
ncbi:MAG TPA: PTS sugar transporter subunit IIA, partial [Sedimentisphaerales bacterium]|nr:PTS sugar transporter subunit IIA [Sedimentisphaerales bacterium]